MEATPRAGDQDLRALAVDLHSLSRLTRRLGEDQLGLHPLPDSDHEVMRLVTERPGCSVTQVAHALRLQPSNASASVRRLRDLGLLERRTDERDQRRARLYPTAVSGEHHERLEARWSATLAAALARLDPADAATVLAAREAFGRLARALEEF